MSTLVLVLTVLIVGVVVLSGAYLPKRYVLSWRKAYANRFEDPRLKILAHGILAASSHNMQPWLVKLDERDTMTTRRGLAMRR